jgi:hypothetical protein
MGNTVTTPTAPDPDEPAPNLTTITKSFVSNTTVPTRNTPARVPNEPQYTQDAVFSFVAYKNQDPNTDSDLHVARRNFENKYNQFLIFFGQYSNAALIKPTLTVKAKPDTIRFPVTNDTNIFDEFEWKKPIRPI